MKIKAFWDMDFYGVLGKVTFYSLWGLVFIMLLAIGDHFIFEESFRDVLNFFGKILLVFFLGGAFITLLKGIV